MTNKKYAVIGGQYESICYGVVDTLLKAKRLATKESEPWDNFQGVHKPEIFDIDDTEVTISEGRISSFDGEEIRIPKDDARCAYYWDSENEKWVQAK